MHLMSDLLCGNLLILNDISQQYNAPRGEAIDKRHAENHKTISFMASNLSYIYISLHIRIQHFIIVCERGKNRIKNREYNKFY